jgi:hypothetical protein
LLNLSCNLTQVKNLLNDVEVKVLPRLFFIFRVLVVLSLLALRLV